MATSNFSPRQPWRPRTAARARPAPAPAAWARAALVQWHGSPATTAWERGPLSGTPRRRGLWRGAPPPPPRWLAWAGAAPGGSAGQAWPRRGRPLRGAGLAFDPARRSNSSAATLPPLLPHSRRPPGGSSFPPGGGLSPPSRLPLLPQLAAKPHGRRPSLARRPQVAATRSRRRRSAALPFPS
jgi:hypothetical protein